MLATAPKPTIAEPWRISPDRYARHMSAGRWKWYPYLKYTGKVIADAIRRGNGRVIINMPPRHGKSELGSFWTPIWFLDNDPAKRVILCSYEGGVAQDWGRRVRNEMGSNDAINARLADDSKAVGRWHTPEGGGMTSTGTGGPISGRGADLILVDDPHKNWAEAHSVTTRDRIIEWFNSTLYTRREPFGNIIVIATRWHEEDLCGYLIEHHADDWAVVTLPAYAGMDDPLGREPGDVMCPQRYDRADLEQTRLAVGGAVWSALYQQAPEALGVGRAYNHYSTSNLVEGTEYDPAMGPLHLSVDFNRTPHMHAVFGQQDSIGDVLWAIDEIADSKVRNARQTAFAAADWVKARGGAVREIHVFGDATGKAKNVETSESAWDILIAALRTRLPDVNIRVRVPKANPPVIDRVNTFNECLRDIGDAVHYKVDKRCRHLLADLREVKTDEAGQPRKVAASPLTHASDAEGYRVHYIRPIRLPQRASRARIGFVNTP